MTESVNINYLHIEGGHCFVCHKDYKGPDHYSKECVEKIIKSPQDIKYCGKLQGKECEFNKMSNKLQSIREEYEARFRPIDFCNTGSNGIDYANRTRDEIADFFLSKFTEKLREALKNNKKKLDSSGCEICALCHNGDVCIDRVKQDTYNQALSDIRQAMIE